MIDLSPSSRQPMRQPWTLDRLIHERSIALGFSIDSSTSSTYTSALNSYITFCKLHNFPIEPTPETLSFFTVYMSHYIKPDSVDSYLRLISGICNQLEDHFPEVRKNGNSRLVSKTSAGCKRMRGTATKRKHCLSVHELAIVLRWLLVVWPPTMIFCSRASNRVLCAAAAAPRRAHISGQSQPPQSAQSLATGISLLVRDGVRVFITRP